MSDDLKETTKNTMQVGKFSAIKIKMERARERAERTGKPVITAIQGEPKDEELIISESEHKIIVAGKKADMVNHPYHYTVGSMETIDIIEKIVEKIDNPFYAYLVSNVVKYVCRFEHKEKSLEDVKKAEWYLKKLIRIIERDSTI